MILCVKVEITKATLLSSCLPPLNDAYCIFTDVPYISHMRHKCLSLKALDYFHYNDTIMGEMTSQITGVSIVQSTVCSSADQRKHQSSASLAFVRGIHWWPVNSPHKRPVARKMYPFDDVIMCYIVNGPSVLWSPGACTYNFAVDVTYVTCNVGRLCNSIDS